MQSRIFSIITQAIQIIQADSLFKKHLLLLLSMLKTVVKNIFRVLWWIESSKEQYLFKIDIFCNIINTFTITFDQFNAFLLNISLHFILTSNLQRVVYIKS